MKDLVWYTRNGLRLNEMSNVGTESKQQWISTWIQHYN